MDIDDPYESIFDMTTIPKNWPTDKEPITYPLSAPDAGLAGGVIDADFSQHHGEPDCLFWYDQPLLFTGVWNGARRLFNLLDDGEPGQPYSETTLRLSVSTPTGEQEVALRENKLAIRDASLAGELFIMEVTSAHKVLRVWPVETIVEADLAEAGYTLIGRIVDGENVSDVISP